MESHLISEDLQKDCDILILNFKNSIYKNFANKYEGEEMDAFFGGMIQVILLETFYISHKMPAESKIFQEEILKGFRSRIDTSFRPLFVEIGRYGQEIGIPKNILIDYCYHYAYTSISKIAPLKVSQDLNKRNTAFLEDLKRWEAEKPFVTKHHLVTLLLMALQDGDLSVNEECFLQEIAEKHNVDLNEIKRDLSIFMNQNPVIPVDLAEKLNFFNNLVSMMVIDNNIINEKIDFCKKIGVMYGYSESDILSYIKIVENAINTQESEENAKQIGQLMSKYLY